MPTRRSLLVAGAGVAMAGFGGYRAVSGFDGGGSEGESDAVATADVSLYATDATTSLGIDLAGTPVVGSRDADIDLYYWSDYQCPFCGRFEANVLPKLLRNEVAAGTVRVPLLELPNIGSASTTAAVLSRCVWRQVRGSNPDAFLRWHAAVFDAQEKPNSGWATRENLLDVTGGVEGVDADAAEQCANGNGKAMERQVRDEKRMAGDRGIQVTPGFVAYNSDTGERETMTGAQPYERFRSTIEAVDDA